MDVQPPSRRGILLKMSLAAGAVLLYLAAVQAVLWVLDEPPDPTVPGQYDHAYAGIDRRSEDPVLRTELIPGANGVVNADGYVGPAYPRARPPGTLRVLGLGDSITMYFSAERQNYLFLTEQLLNERYDAPIQILNFGVASYDTVAEVRQLEVRGLAYQPDVVTVGYCLNDGVDFVFSVNEATGRFDVDPADYSVPGVIEAIQRTVASPHATLSPDAFFARVFGSPQWLASMAALDRLAALSAEHGFEVVLLVFPVLLDFDRYAFQPVHDALRAKARALGFGLLDLLAAYRRHGDARAIGTDGGDVIHPNATGHRITARALSHHLVVHGYLERARAPR